MVANTYRLNLTVMLVETNYSKVILIFGNAICYRTMYSLQHNAELLIAYDNTPQICCVLNDLLCQIKEKRMPYFRPKNSQTEITVPLIRLLP